MNVLIDNYDSFSYILADYFKQADRDPLRVIKNDELSPGEVLSLEPSRIIISPGPCGPEATGVCQDLIRKVAGVIPIFGICLGHQTIAHVFGAKVSRAIKPVHGKSSMITSASCELFNNIELPLEVARYHSLVVNTDNFPNCLDVTSKTDEGEIMSLRHNKLKHVYGVQFHPESILTKDGLRIVENFLEITA